MAVALPLFQTALDANPMIQQFSVTYIDGLILERQFKNYKLALKKGKKKGVAKEKLKALTRKLVSFKYRNSPPEASSQNQLSSLLDYYQNERYDVAEKLAISITEQFPSHQFSWKNSISKSSWLLWSFPGKSRFLF